MTTTDNFNPADLHDPSSHYFDPTLNEQASQSAMIRQYFGFGSSDLAARALDNYEDALAHVSKFFVGDQPAAICATPEMIADQITSAESWEINRNPRTGESVVDKLASAETLLARSILPSGGGLGSVTMDLAGECPKGSYDPFFWDYALHEPIFLPVISFIRVADDGIISRLRLNGPVAVVAYTPTSIIDLAERKRPDGTVRPARLAASLYRDRSGGGGPIWHGIVTTLSDADAEPALTDLRDAVKTVAQANRKTSDQAEPEVKVPAPQPTVRL